MICPRNQEHRQKAAQLWAGYQNEQVDSAEAVLRVRDDLCRAFPTLGEQDAFDVAWSVMGSP